MVEDRPLIDSGCIACGHCVEHCPEEAIEVTVVDLDTDEEVTYQLLGQEESDVKNGTISIFSPLGKAMIGKSVGDEINVKTPSGERQLEIVEIQQGSRA